MLGRSYTEKEHTKASLVVVLLCAVATFWAVNFAAGAFLEHNGTNLGYINIDHKWRVLGKQSEPIDWLILGDSAVSQGFDPSLFNESTGKNAINLGTIGNFGLTDDQWMLEEYLSRHDPPEAVVLVHVYDVWHRRLSRKVMGRVPRRWIFSERIAEEYGLDTDARQQIALNNLMPLYAQRTSLRKSIEYVYWRYTMTDDELATLRTKDRSLPVKEPQRHADGFIALCGALPRAVKRDAAGHRRFLRKGRKFRISRDNKKALGEILKLSKKHDFEVYLVPAPIYKGLANNKAFKKYFAGSMKYFNSLASRWPHLHVVPELKTFETDQMQNADHIACEAVPEYSEWMTQRVLDAQAQAQLN